MFYFNIFPDKLPIDTKKSQSNLSCTSCYNDIREKSLALRLCPEYAKGGFAMCKRKIKTVKVLLSLLLFAAVMFQIPSDVHAQVETMTTKPALCSKAVSYSSAAKASAAKKATATFRSSKTTLWVGHKLPCVPLSL